MGCGLRLCCLPLRPPTFPQDPSRFARNLVTQEVGHKELVEQGFRLIAVSSPGQFLDEDNIHNTLIRQIMGAISEFEKSSIVRRLRAARLAKEKKTKDRTLKGKAKVVGRKSALEGRGGEVFRKVLAPFVGVEPFRGENPKAAAALKRAGLTTADGNDFSLSQVRTWLAALRGLRAK